MRRSIGLAIGFGLPLASCHPPDQQIYDDSIACVGVFDVALKQLPNADIRKAGLYRDDLDRQALETFEGALESGSKLAKDNRTVSREVDQAKRRAWQTYGNPHAQSSGKLLAAVKQCLPKPEGPND